MSGWQGAQQLHANGGKAVVYSGMLDCFSQTVREEGLKALFKVSPLPPSHGPIQALVVERERDYTHSSRARADWMSHAPKARTPRQMVH